MNTLDFSSFHLQNPWRVGKYQAEQTFRREVLDNLLDWLADPDILVLVGSRQVGKTTLIFQIIDQLFTDGTSPDDVFYFNLDDLTLLEFFKSPAEFIDFVELHKTGRGYVFIDEVQRLENPGLFLKYIYDLKLDIKLIVTGSSSLEIRTKISESLTGRKQLFHLYSFSFSEYISIKWPEFRSLEKKLGIQELKSLAAACEKVQGMYQGTFERWFAEYATFGGYPRVVLERDPQRKMLLLKEIFASYLQRDIKDFFRIENVSGYNNLLKILANQIGNLVNVSELANTIGLNKVTVEKYLQVLEGTFMFKRVSPFFRNVRRELSKMPKTYAMDLGLRNLAVGNFNDLFFRGDRGEMVENFVFDELQRQLAPPDEIHFWRTQTRAEVDLVLEFPNRIVPIEIKFRPMQAAQMSRSFVSFLDSYAPSLAFVLTKAYLNKIKRKKTEIIFLPFWALLFLKMEYLK